MNIKKVVVVFTLPALLGIGLFVDQHPEYLRMTLAICGIVFWATLGWLKRSTIRPSDFNVPKSNMEGSTLNSNHMSDNAKTSKSE